MIKSFNYHQSTQILFGNGRIKELGEISKKFGTRALLVTTPASTPARAYQYKMIYGILSEAGIEVFHFDGVIPNPTVDIISAGAKIARECRVEMIIGVGGGSSMDTAKAISVEATHSGTSWDYLFYKTPQPDEKKLLPIINVSTTSGTGSQVTQVAVVTNSNTRDKSALYNNVLYPKISIVDPELTIGVPKFVTATTGFDVFCHAFESTLNPATGAYVDLLAWEAIRLVNENLPQLLDDLHNLSLRSNMALADIYAGLCIANAGVTLPHGMGMAIGGMYPQIAHGEALAIVYPAFTRFTWKSAIPQFSKLAKLFNPELQKLSDEQAAEKSVDEIDIFLQKIGLWFTLEEKGVPGEEMEMLAKQCMVLPDYKANPRIASNEEMFELVRQSFNHTYKSVLV